MSIDTIKIKIVEGIHINGWLVENYPKLYNYYKNSNHPSLFDFCIGNNIKKLSHGQKLLHALNYNALKKYIKENEHMHNIWML